MDGRPKFEISLAEAKHFAFAFAVRGSRIHQRRLATVAPWAKDLTPALRALVLKPESDPQAQRIGRPANLWGRLGKSGMALSEKS